jgi:hypothetical protein
MKSMIEKECANMKENEKLINEFFFKKKPKTVADKMKSKFGYEPQDSRKEGQPGFGSIMDTGLAVTDPQEAGKRVVSALGASLGVNSVKNMASKSIKSFPIIISENVEPETSVMIKRVMEEQYAEYISLLISNQIVDISAFKTSEGEGNIAIQALDIVSPEDEDKSLKRKLVKGEVSADDMLKNLTAYNLIRNEGKEYKTNNALIDALLEGAVIVPSSESKSLVEFFQDNSEGISILNELTDVEEKLIKSEIEKKMDAERSRFVTLDKLLLGAKDGNLDSKEALFNKLRGYDRTAVPSAEMEEYNNKKEALELELDSLERELARLQMSPTPGDLDKAEQELDTLEFDLVVLKRLPSSITRNDDIKKQNLAIGYKIREIDRLKDAVRNPREHTRLKSEAEKEKDIVERKIRNLRKPEDSGRKGTYSRLTTTSILVDKDQLQKSLDSSLGELLLNENNKAIRERFERATFLLQANRIAGLEYIEYVTQRLGMPIPKQVRAKLVVEYKITDIIDPQAGLGSRISRRDVERIKRNEKVTTLIIQNVLKTKVLNVLKAAALATGTATLTLAAQGTLGSTVAAMTANLGTLGLGAVATAAWLPAVVGLGTFAVASLIRGLLDSKKAKIQKNRKVQGWERVEALIMAMEEQQADVRRLSVTKQIQKLDDEQSKFDSMDERLEYLKKEQLDKVMDDYHTYIAGIAKAVKPTDVLQEDLEYTVEDFESLLEQETLISEFIEGIAEHKAALLEYNFLNEAKVQTTIPVDLELKYEYDTKKAPDVLVAPKFSTRSQYAYGSVEYDKRELKDRKYNAPLLMKVNFKERFSDGTFSDNELTAVIGILGVITRVPSKEMEYVLSSSAAGDTVKGIFSQDGDPTKLISNILGVDKIKKDVQNLPQSSDVWQNLEKVSRLAVSNRLAGNKSNNIANAHIIFAQKEIDNVRANENVDYLKNIKLVESLMKRYSAFTVMVANDVSERLYIFDSMSSASWDVVPYSAFRNKDTGDQLNAMLNKMSSGRL